MIIMIRCTNNIDKSTNLSIKIVLKSLGHISGPIQHTEGSRKLRILNFGQFFDRKFPLRCVNPFKYDKIAVITAKKVLWKGPNFLFKNLMELITLRATTFPSSF